MTPRRALVHVLGAGSLCGWNRPRVAAAALGFAALGAFTLTLD